MQHSDPLDQIVAWAAARPDVRAALLTSTRARPGAQPDALSDYDVILALTAVEPLVADHAWLDDFGEVLVAYWDPVAIDPELQALAPPGAAPLAQSGNVVQFAGGLKIDFTLWPAGLLERLAGAERLPDELDAGYRVLVDKDGLAARLRPPTYQAYTTQPPDEQAFALFVNDFLTDPPYVAKCLWRGELLPAKWCLDYDMKHVYLRQLLEWRAAVEGGWGHPADGLGRGLRGRLPPELWAQLERCYAGAELAENWRALDQTMALFRRAGAEVAAALGYRYPHELHERVAAYVAKIREMPGSARPG